MGSESVLKKLLKEKPEEIKLIEKILKPAPAAFQKRASKRPGRPKVADAKKARNFTLCLAPQYLEFLDKMIVKDTKVQGRGRKIRFIIDRFIEHEKRSLSQIRVLRESLQEVQKELQALGGRVRKGERLQLSTKENGTITQSVKQVHTLIKILGYSPKNLQKLLPKEEWAILSFCLDWGQKRELKF
jgi:hypothetical protein